MAGEVDRIGAPGIPANRSRLTAVIAFILLDEAAHADGAVVEVDGGLAAG